MYYTYLLINTLAVLFSVVSGYVPFIEMIYLDFIEFLYTKRLKKRVRVQDHGDRLILRMTLKSFFTTQIVECKLGNVFYLNNLNLISSGKTGRQISCELELK